MHKSVTKWNATREQLVEMVTLLEEQLYACAAAASSPRNPEIRPEDPRYSVAYAEIRKLHLARQS
jgi:hypothetical protein